MILSSPAPQFGQRCMSAALAPPVQAAETPVCPLCERPIPAQQRDARHLVPRSRGGRATEYLHRICHRQIHALLSETELARDYHTVDALLAHPDIASLVAWVRDKPPDLALRARKSQRLRGR